MPLSYTPSIQYCNLWDCASSPVCSTHCPSFKPGEVRCISNSVTADFQVLAIGRKCTLSYATHGVLVLCRGRRGKQGRTGIVRTARQATTDQAKSPLRVG